MPQHGIDRLQLMYGAPYEASKNIIMKHPTVGDIVFTGEERYFDVVNLLTAIPSDMKAPLFDSGIDYMDISDFQLFTMLIRNIKREDCELFFNGVDLTQMQFGERSDGERFLAIPNTNLIIDQLIHARMCEFLKSVFSIKKKVQKAGNPITKRMLIEEDRERRAAAKKRSGTYKSSLRPLISSLVNSDGFKYNYDDVLKMPFSQFMDAAERTQHITNTNRLAMGYFTGSFDSKKFNTNKLDWTKDLADR